MIAIPKPLRVAGLFLANLFAAVVGTSMMDSGITQHVFHPGTLQASSVVEDLVSAAVAFVLGYVGYWKLRSSSAKWVWIVGLCWFGERMLSNVTRIDRMFFLESSYRDVQPTPKMFETWVSYTLPFVRTVFYSAGALFCSHVGERGLRSVFSRSAPLDGQTALSDHDSTHPAPPS